MKLFLCQIYNVRYNKIIFLYKDLQTMYIDELHFIITNDKLNFLNFENLLLNRILFCLFNLLNDL